MIGGNKNPDLYALNNLFVNNVGTAAARFGVGDKLNAVKTHDPWLGDQWRASESGSLSPADFSHLSASPAPPCGPPAVIGQSDLGQPHRFVPSLSHSSGPSGPRASELRLPRFFHVFCKRRHINIPSNCGPNKLESV